MRDVDLKHWRVFCSLQSNIKRYQVYFIAILSLFVTYVACILNYSCEYFNLNSAEPIEGVHRKV